MNCGDIRELLPRWADRDEGGLSDEERHLVARHLEACPDCQQAVKELEVMTTIVRALPPIGVPWSVEHRARELGHFRVQRITTETALELTAALGARPEVVRVTRREDAVPGAIGAAGDETAPAPMASMAAPRANRMWIVVAVVAVVVVVLAALAYSLLR